MRFFIIFLLLITPGLCFAQKQATYELAITRLQDCELMDNSVVHTIKVEVTNPHDKPKALYLIQNEKITGYNSAKFKGEWNNPLSFMSETSMVVPKYWTPTQFATWFKKLDPGETFTFYFQSPRKLSNDDLKSIIRMRDLPPSSQARKLSYKNSEVVVPLR